MNASNSWRSTIKYKGFLIWNPSETYWLADPEWSVEAVENFRNSMEFAEHRTINEAKKWIREVGILLKEKDYLNSVEN